MLTPVYFINIVLNILYSGCCIVFNNLINRYCE